MRVTGQNSHYNTTDDTLDARDNGSSRRPVFTDSVNRRPSLNRRVMLYETNVAAFWLRGCCI